VSYYFYDGLVTSRIDIDRTSQLAMAAMGLPKYQAPWGLGCPERRFAAAGKRIRRAPLAADFF
jgi:hypothetical protein